MAHTMVMIRAATVMLCALVIVLGPMRPAGAESTGLPVATGASLEAADGTTRFTMTFDREVPFRIFALADPYRVIVDLPQTEFTLPPGAGQEGEGVVSAYRFGLLMVGKSRIVLDSEKPVSIETAAVEPGPEGAEARLVIALRETSREKFLAVLEDQRTPRPPESPHATDGGDKPAASARSDEYVVVLDPGHGGIDGGAVGAGGILEKEIVLAFARTLQEELEKNENYKVLMTRDSDIFLSLADRVAFARHHGASLFVSIHADKFRGASVRGATVYTLSEDASDAEAADLAAKENKADLIAGLDLDDEPDEVTDILISLAQRETKNLSVNFAKRLVTSMKDKVRLNRNPHRFAGFRVLKAPDVPSVLVELGYVSNASDVREMKSQAWRRKASQAIAAAVERFRANQFAGARNR